MAHTDHTKNRMIPYYMSTHPPTNPSSHQTHTNIYQQKVKQKPHQAKKFSIKQNQNMKQP